MSIRWQRFRSVCVAAVVPLTAVLPVSAIAVTQFQKSVFTAFSIADCEALKSHAGGSAYLCPGLPDFPIYLAEGNGRSFVSSGAAPAEAKAATQTLSSFNTPFAKRTRRATVEWRFVIRNDRKVPYAMIVRFFTSSDAAHGEVLVVTRIQRAEACHVALIDALANSDAIVLARRIADERARSFACAANPTIEGETGKSPM